MSKKDTFIVGEHSRSLSITMPKDIADKLDIKKGTMVTFKIQGDIITLYKTNPTVPIDIVTQNVFDLTSKIRDLKKKEVELEENYINDKIDYKDRLGKLNDFYITLKHLNKQFEELKKYLDKASKSIGETFVPIPRLQKIEDVFALERMFNTDFPSDYQITLEFIRNLISNKRKYQDLIKKTEDLQNSHKIDSKEASEIISKFASEISEDAEKLDTIKKLVAGDRPQTL